MKPSRVEQLDATKESTTVSSGNRGSALGICTLSKFFYWAVLEGSRESPALTDRRRVPVPPSMNTAELMTWYWGQISNLLDSHMPAVVAARLPTPSRGFPLSVPFMEKAIFPNAVVHLLCQQRDPPIPVQDYTNQSFTARRFGRTKPPEQTNLEVLFEMCDSVLDHQGPYWDAYQREAVLAAWLALR